MLISKLFRKRIQFHETKEFWDKLYLRFFSSRIYYRLLHFLDKEMCGERLINSYYVDYSSDEKSFSDPILLH